MSPAAEDAPHICLIAGEHSGDQLGAGLMKALIDATGGAVRFSGIGGPQMIAAGASRGFEPFFAMEELTLSGIFEILPHIPRILRRIKETADKVRGLGPDVVVTIDSPQFAIRLGWKLRSSGIPHIHYVAPTVWAWRPGRARIMARFLRHLLMIYPFEAPYFEKWGLPATFVGHPVAELGLGLGDGAGFRARHGFTADQPLLCVLPGSRRSEVGRLLPVFGETLEMLAARIPDLGIVVPTVESVADKVTVAAAWPLQVAVVEGFDDRRDAFAAADVALAASGTVTYELAMAGVPMVIAYRLGWPSYVVVKAMSRTRYASVVNMVLGREVAPEFLQGACTAPRLAAAVGALLTDADARARQRADLGEVACALGRDLPPASARAAEVVLGIAREGAGGKAGN